MREQVAFILNWETARLPDKMGLCLKQRRQQEQGQSAMTIVLEKTVSQQR